MPNFTTKPQTHIEVPPALVTISAKPRFSPRRRLGPQKRQSHTTQKSRRYQPSQVRT
jgi:hypothetical protein